MKRAAIQRRTPLARKVIERQRATPLRKTRKGKPAKPKVEIAYHGEIKKLQCTVCGASPVDVHHVRFDGRTSMTRNHRFVIPLCIPHHRVGHPEAVHEMGNPQFEALHGFSQIERARELWETHS